MGFVKKLLIEALEEPEVMRIELFSPQVVDHRSDASRLFAHAVKFPRQI